MNHLLQLSSSFDWFFALNIWEPVYTGYTALKSEMSSIPFGLFLGLPVGLQSGKVVMSLRWYKYLHDFYEHEEKLFTSIPLPTQVL